MPARLAAQCMKRRIKDRPHGPPPVFSALGFNFTGGEPRPRRGWWYEKEDQYLFEHFFSTGGKPPYKRAGTFVELGANDGLHASNTRWFERALGWSGVLIEGTPTTYTLLQHNRGGNEQNKLVNAVVCPEGTLVSYRVPQAAASDVVPGCPSHCSGNGYCEGGVTCKCYPGWDGVDCATSICSEGCSGHGACSTNNTCVCDEGWSAFDCSLSECPDACGGIGICLGGACMCPGNAFGVACERTVCSGTPPCNGNGECVIKAPMNADTGMLAGTPEPVCECFEGYHGLDCSLAECLHGCSGRGVCQGGLGPNAVATCLCDPGWGGADCSLSVCASNCSGRGACVNGSCWCEPGWSGPECSWQRCLFDCSGRGVCNGRGKCHCAPGWHGIDCSLFDWGEGDSGRVTQSCAAHCLDGCQEQCSAVAEMMGAEHADDCLLHCTDLCVPACGEAQGRAQRQAAAAATATLLPPPPPAALPPPSPVATLSSTGAARRGLAYAGADLARELLDERVPEAMPRRLGMVEEREPSESTTGSYLDGLASAMG